MGNISKHDLNDDQIQFELSKSDTFSESTLINFDTSNINESINIEALLGDLEPKNTYYYRLKVDYNNKLYLSDILHFTTKPDYEFLLYNTLNNTSTTVKVAGRVNSFDYEVSDITFQCGTNESQLNRSVNAVEFYEENYYSGEFADLEPATNYFFRMRGIRNGQEIYSELSSFETEPDFHISMSANISLFDVQFHGFVNTFQYPISDLIIELGSSRYLEYQIQPEIFYVAANSSESIHRYIPRSSFSEDHTYYYRLKGLYNGKIVQTPEYVFNLSERLIMVAGIMEDYQGGAIHLKGLINRGNNFDFLKDLSFEYGLTEEFGYTLRAAPNDSDTFRADVLSASIENPKQNATYYYRISANLNGETIYSPTYLYNTKIANTDRFSLDLLPTITTDNNVELEAIVTADSGDITDLVFQYGSINYEHEIGVNQPSVLENNTRKVSAKLSNLENDTTQYFRLKGSINGATIYSEEAVFNSSGNLTMVTGTVEESENGTLLLKGLVNCGFYDGVSNIAFEYGLTKDLGNFVSGSLNSALGNSTLVTRAEIQNVQPNETYFYRLVAENNGEKLMSETYQYTTKTLNINEVEESALLEIFPNPVSEYLTISLNDKEDIKDLQIYTIDGKRVMHIKETENPTTIKLNLEHLKNGLYVLKLNTKSNKVLYKKLLKQ